MHFSMAIKLETDIKLNLITNEGQSLIDLDNILEKRAPETHFIQFESVHATYPIGLGIIKEIYK